MSRTLPWTEPAGDGLAMTIELAVYPLDVVLRACHTLTARCFVFSRLSGSGTVLVTFAPREAGEALDELAGEFSNALLDHCLRARIAAETQAVRDLLVAQAFCEADLLDRDDSESDERLDVRRIAG
jgi:His-Xaa-Ser system protein HxsD